MHEVSSWLIASFLMDEEEVYFFTFFLADFSVFKERGYNEGFGTVEKH